MSKKYDYIDPSTPVLMYYDTYIKRKDLIALDGSTVSSSTATGLRKLYHGNILLTEPIKKLTEGGYVNDTCKLTVDRSKGLYLPSHLFGEAITLSNVGAVSQQWLTGDTDIHHTHTVSIEFLKESWVVNEYWMIGAVGEPEYIDKAHPTPKRWTLLGKLREEDTWHILSNHNERRNTWEPWKVKSFVVPRRNQRKVDMVKLEVTEWHENPNSNSTGLKRLWLFGHREHEFVLPNIPSPDSNYVYVVSRRKPPKEE